MYARVENGIITFLIPDKEYEQIGNKEDFAHINDNIEIPADIETDNGVPKYLYDNGNFNLRSDVDISNATLENKKKVIRRQREQEFSKYLDRSQYFFETLTETQHEELRAWRQSWLDATETFIIPERPNWLN